MAAKHDDHPKHEPAKPSPQDGPPQPAHRPPQAPVETQSQKSQISQYFKSQGRQPDDVVYTINGLNLRLKDLD